MRRSGALHRCRHERRPGIPRPGATGADLDLSALPIRALLNLFDAFEGADDAFAAVYTMPRCEHGVGQGEIHDEIERCTGMMQAIAAEITVRGAATREEKRDRGEVMIRWGLKTGDWVDIGMAYAETVAGPHL